MRLFIAIQPSEEVILELQRAQAALTSGLSKPKTFHLTLKFLGEADVAIAEKLKSVSFEPFDIKLSPIGAFPDMARPRVIWAGIEKSPELEKLKLDIDKALPDYKDDKPFSPHFTLARVKKPLQLESVPDLASLSFHVKSFELIQSVLKPEGPEYRIVASYGKTI